MKFMSPQKHTKQKCKTRLLGGVFCLPNSEQAPFPATRSYCQESYPQESTRKLLTIAQPLPLPLLLPGPISDICH